nr:MAG TPA: hypothetical protein [Caudoviricetes sp.]
MNTCVIVTLWHMNTGYQYNALVSHKVNSYPGMGNNKRIATATGNKY